MLPLGSVFFLSLLKKEGFIEIKETSPIIWQKTIILGKERVNSCGEHDRNNIVLDIFISCMILTKYGLTLVCKSLFMTLVK